MSLIEVKYKSICWKLFLFIGLKNELSFVSRDGLEMILTNISLSVEILFHGHLCEKEGRKMIYFLF